MSESEVRKYLAQKSMEEMWGHVSSFDTYITKACPFCRLAEKNCRICLADPIGCSFEHGKMERDTLINVIRGALKEKNQKVFDEALYHIRNCLNSTIAFGHIDGFAKQKAVDFIKQTKVREVE